MWALFWMACHLHSGLAVPAGERFILGDNPHGRFSVRVVNVGVVPVELVVEEAGAIVSTATLQPGDRTRARFQAQQAAIFVNAGEQEANLSVDINGDIGLSMNYTPLPE